MQDTVAEKEKGKKSSLCRWALWSLVLGIASLLIGLFGTLPAILCGHKARSKVKKSGGRLKGLRMATCALVLAYLLFVFQVLAIWRLTHSFTKPPSSVDLKAVHGLTVDKLVASGSSIEEMGRICLAPLVPEKTDIGIVLGVISDGKTEVYSYGEVGYGGDTVFEIGSVSKVFTGVALATMVRDGKVALVDPMTNFLPDDVKPPLIGTNEIQLVHLSSHSSGLPRLMANFSIVQGVVFAFTGKNNPYKGYDIKHLYDGVRKTKPKIEPGVRYEYSNFGGGLLGQLLANADKSDYESVVCSRICEPFGMKDTVVKLTPELKERLAPARLWSGSAATNWDLYSLAGAGGIRSTVNDLLIFIGEHLQPSKPGFGKVVSLVLTEQFRQSEESSVGLNWHCMKKEGEELWWHNGGTGGYSAFIGLNRQKQVGVAILGNANFADDLTRSGFKLLAALSRFTKEKSRGPE